MLCTDWGQENWIEVDRPLTDSHPSFVTAFDWFVQWLGNRGSTVIVLLIEAVYSGLFQTSVKSQSVCFKVSNIYLY